MRARVPPFAAAGGSFNDNDLLAFAAGSRMVLLSIYQALDDFAAALLAAVEADGRTARLLTELASSPDTRRSGFQIRPARPVRPHDPAGRSSAS